MPVSGQNVGVQIMSVTGPVQPCDLGVVLPHEHVFADLVREYRGTGLLNDEYLARRELEAFAAAGGTTLVDLTVDEIGRNPPALRRAAEAAGVTIVMGCGHYRDPYLDRAWFDRHTVEAEVRRFVTANPRAALTGEPLTQAGRMQHSGHGVFIDTPASQV
jgi:phosphotriesterase-related protein